MKLVKNIRKPLAAIMVIITIVSFLFFVVPLFESWYDEYHAGYSFTNEPEFPKGSTDQSSSKWVVTGRHTYSGNRSSKVHYYLDLTNSEGETDRISVSMDEFVEVKDQTVCHKFSYVIKPDYNYWERVNIVVSSIWPIVLIFTIIPLGISVFLIVDEITYYLRHDRKNFY